MKGVNPSISPPRFSRLAPLLVPVYNVYLSVSGEWREVNPSESPPPRFSFVSGVTNGYMYVSTGEGPNDLFLDDIWRFDIK